MGDLPHDGEATAPGGSLPANDTLGDVVGVLPAAPVGDDHGDLNLPELRPEEVREAQRLADQLPPIPARLPNFDDEGRLEAPVPVTLRLLNRCAGEEFRDVLLDDRAKVPRVDVGPEVASLLAETGAGVNLGRDDRRGRGEVRLASAGHEGEDTPPSGQAQDELAALRVNRRLGLHWCAFQPTVKNQVYVETSWLSVTSAARLAPHGFSRCDDGHCEVVCEPGQLGEKLRAVADLFAMFLQG